MSQWRRNYGEPLWVTWTASDEETDNEGRRELPTIAELDASSPRAAVKKRKKRASVDDLNKKIEALQYQVATKLSKKPKKSRSDVASSSKKPAKGLSPKVLAQRQAAAKPQLPLTVRQLEEATRLKVREIAKLRDEYNRRSAVPLSAIDPTAPNTDPATAMYMSDVGVAAETAAVTLATGTAATATTASTASVPGQHSTASVPGQHSTASVPGRFGMVATTAGATAAVSTTATATANGGNGESQQSTGLLQTVGVRSAGKQGGAQRQDYAQAARPMAALVPTLWPDRFTQVVAGTAQDGVAEAQLLAAQTHALNLQWQVDAIEARISYFEQQQRRKVEAAAKLRRDLHMHEQLLVELAARHEAQSANADGAARS